MPIPTSSPVTMAECFMTWFRTRLTVRLMAMVLALAMVAGGALPAVAKNATLASTPAGGSTPVAGTPMIVGPHLFGLGGADLSTAVAALVSVQTPDGAFPGFGGAADPGTTADTIIALAAARKAGAAAGDSIDKAIAYLSANGESFAENGDGQRAKLVLALEAGGANAGDVAGHDFWAPIQGGDYSGGTVGAGSFDLALVVLASVATASDRTAEFADLLVKAQLADGSWEFGADQGGDTNTTSLAVQALTAAGGVDQRVIDNAMAFLAKARAADGGYAYQPAADGQENVADANSSALVLQAEIAAAVPGDSETFQQDATALASFQNPSGQFRYADDQPDDNLFATVQAIPALAGLPLPIQAS